MADDNTLDLNKTDLWIAFEKKADNTQKVMVEKVTKKSASRLDLVRDTFPTYTLHNQVHALNVVKLMGKLLDDRIDDISALEGAILILSAYCHDVGMAFKDEDRKKLRQEDDFERFLREHPEALVQMENAEALPEEVAEWYCRWIHPERVFQFLNDLGDDLKWNSSQLTKALGHVCNSHGCDAKILIPDEIFSKKYRGEADLKFCAILLRLADILDFDNSRAPEEVYKYLGIERRTSKKEAVSDTEWKKHLASQGFTFDRSNHIRSLLFTAEPDHPAVEYDIRQFLDVIEAELQKCRGVLEHCSERWQTFSLPSFIDREGIQSKGYKYGEYRFTLDQQNVLQLLMGENLYSEPFTFVRELVQNSIDTSRHREFYEKSRGNSSFSAKPIEVSSWVDAEGYQWVRMDDFGMGMSEEIIKDYFLKVGESYYQSSKFRASILALNTSKDEDFLPISRFGIGILSCFIACDRVEVSTRHIENKDGAIRLSLSGLHSFYILQLQTETDKYFHALPMPAPSSKGITAYRGAKDYGTSIAVRIDPRKEKGVFDIENLLKKNILCSPVPIVFKGKLIGGDFDSLIDKPWVDSIQEFKLTEDEVRELENVFKVELSDVIVRLVPLNLTKSSPNPNLKGQGIAGTLTFLEEDQKKLQQRLELTQKIKKVNRKYGKQQLVTSARSSLYDLHFIFDESFPRIEAHFGKSNLDLWELKKSIEKAINKDEFFQNQPLIPGSKVKYGNNNINSELEIVEQFEAFGDNKCVINLSRIVDQFVSKIGVISEYEIVEDLERGSLGWISHNGICLPLFDSGAGTIDISFHDLQWIKMLVSLQDSLRPNISLSRETLRHLTWDVCSALCLSILTSQQKYSGFLPRKINITIPREIVDNDISLGKILSDPYIVNKSWSREKIIETYNKNYEKERLSLEEIKTRAKDGISVYIPLIYSEHFLHFCSGALIQTGLKMYIERIEEDAINMLEHKQLYNPTHKLTVVSGKALPIKEGQKLFPPLLFVPYRNKNILIERSYVFCSANLNHPFADWLIKVSPKLKAQYPGIFSEIKEALESLTGFSNSSSYTGTNTWNLINEMVKRLQALDKDLVTEEAFIDEASIVLSPIGYPIYRPIPRS